MYLSKQLRKELMKTLSSEKYAAYAIKLKVGIFVEDEETLREIVDMMFLAWRKIAMSGGSYLKNYSGIAKRLFFEFSEEKGGFSPFFYLLCVRLKKNYERGEEYKARVDEERLRIQAYIKWFSSWARVLRLCSEVSVDFALLELDGLERACAEFCSPERYTLFALIDEKKRELLKAASGNAKHKLISWSGAFKDAINRQIDIGR